MFPGIDGKTRGIEVGGRAVSSTTHPKTRHPRRLAVVLCAVFRGEGEWGDRANGARAEMDTFFTSQLEVTPAMLFKAISKLSPSTHSKLRFRLPIHR